jgi:hypothetical protein
VLPFTVGIRDSAVQLVSTLGRPHCSSPWLVDLRPGAPDAAEETFTRAHQHRLARCEGARQQSRRRVRHPRVHL